jgi:hypothetical protein
MFYQELCGSVLNKAFGNRFLFNLPMNADKLLNCINVSDIGECAATVFNNPDKYRNRILPIAGEYIKVSEVTQLLQKNLSPEMKISFPGGGFNRFAFKFLKFPGVEDIRVMFEYFETEKMHRDLKLTKELNPNVIGFNDWLAKNRDTIIKDKTK